jgi:hypothetical protein
VHTIARTNSNPRATIYNPKPTNPKQPRNGILQPGILFAQTEAVSLSPSFGSRVVLCCFILVRLGVGLLAIQFLPSLSGRSRSAVFEARPRERHGPVKPQGDMQCGRYIDDARPIDTPPQSHRTLLFDTLTTKNVAATSPHTRHIRFQPYCTRSLSQRTRGPGRFPMPDALLVTGLSEIEATSEGFIGKKVRRDLLLMSCHAHLTRAPEYYLNCKRRLGSFFFLQIQIQFSVGSHRFFLFVKSQIGDIREGEMNYCRSGRRYKFSQSP